ncbi:hypothetical protein ACFL6D_04725, partial [Spirochaetota bacterium]
MKRTFRRSALCRSVWGGAYIASGSDLNALYYNPAGLSYLFYNEAAASYNNLYGLGIHNGYFAFAFPLFGIANTAVSYEYLYFNDEELEIFDHVIDIGLARNLFIIGLHGGIAGTYHIKTARIDDETIIDETATSYDIGLLYDNFNMFHKLLDPLSCGILI